MTTRLLSQPNDPCLRLAQGAGPGFILIGVKSLLISLWVGWKLCGEDAFRPAGPAWLVPTVKVKLSWEL